MVSDAELEGVLEAEGDPEQGEGDTEADTVTTSTTGVVEGE